MVGEHRELGFEVLDCGIRLAGPAEVVDPLARAYARFAAETPDPGWAAVSVVSTDPPRLEVAGRPVTLAAGVDLAGQVYRWFLRLLLEGVESLAVLHAAALVAPGTGRAVLLAAPSGHGKTGLTLELVERGFRFLGDDYAPLDLARREIHPYWRAVSVREDAVQRIPARASRAVASADAPRLFDKRLLDVGQVYGEEALGRRPAPLGHVILLTAGPPEVDPAESGHAWVDVVVRHDGAAGLVEELSGLDGVEVEGRRDLGGAAALRLRLGGGGSTGRLDELLDGESIVHLEKYWSRRPDFAQPPRAARIPRRVATVALGREMLNRSPGSRFLARYDGSATRLFIELAEALGAADCLRMRVGPAARTAELVERICHGEEDVPE
jgi:hypothetical protein